MFQFLIGIINPFKNALSAMGEKMFQFLIGIINLVFWINSAFPSAEFQFLIGIINLQCPKWAGDSDRVSIPHRYYKSSLIRSTSSGYGLFQFLIGIINPMITLKC